MKTKTIIIPNIIFCLIIGLLSNCSNYYPHTYPFMDWSNPDSIISSYDTLPKTRLDNHDYICRFWIDPSSTVKQYIEICDTNGGYKITKHQFGYAYNKKHKTKRIDISNSVVIDKDINEIIETIDSLDLMNYKSRYHSWQTDGGPMHTPMIWYRVEYYKNGQKNDFVFWKFVNHDLYGDMIKYGQIVDLIDNEILNIKN